MMVHEFVHTFQVDEVTRICYNVGAKEIFSISGTFDEVTDISDLEGVAYLVQVNVLVLLCVIGLFWWKHLEVKNGK